MFSNEKVSNMFSNTESKDSLGFKIRRLTLEEIKTKTKQKCPFCEAGIPLRTITL